jgi:hypothetical protein
MITLEIQAGERYNPHMLQGIIQKSRTITLLCYSVYALSPIYAILPESHSVNGLQYASQHHAEMGIFWLNVLLGSFVDEGRDIGAARSGRLVQAPQDEDLVLVKKKREVNNKSYLVQPPLKQSDFASREVEPPAAVPCTNEIPLDMAHRHADGYYSLRTGLSPPSFIS